MPTKTDVVQQGPLCPKNHIPFSWHLYHKRHEHPRSNCEGHVCARIRAQLTSDRRKVALARPKLEDGVESGQGVVFKGSTQVTELGSLGTPAEAQGLKRVPVVPKVNTELTTLGSQAWAPGCELLAFRW